MRTALILGGAACLEADRAAALELFKPDLLIACNHAGRDEAGTLDHWATMHPELFPKWLEDRRAAGRPEAGQLWHAGHRRTRVGSTPIDSWGGSSGLLSVRVAIHLECDRIVLAGVPMKKGFCHYDRSGTPWNEAAQYWNQWQRRLPQLVDRVRSLSGWTADLLGRPTVEWLHGD